jgi:hypothetical protein
MQIEVHRLRSLTYKIIKAYCITLKYIEAWNAIRHLFTPPFVCLPVAPVACTVLDDLDACNICHFCMSLRSLSLRCLDSPSLSPLCF